METKVIVPGRVSVKMLPLSGPLFPAVMVNVTSVSAAAVPGPSLVTNKSVPHDCDGHWSRSCCRCWNPPA